MGFFDRLKQKSDNFFDALQQNAIDKALAAARYNDQKDDSVNKIKNLKQLYNNASQEEKNDHASVEVKKWNYPDKEWEMWHNTGMDRAEWEKFMDKQKDIANQAIIKENEKRERLLKIYTKEQVDKIMSKQLWLGMTEETLFEARNRPLDISESVSKGVVKKKHYYDKSTNRLGNDAFDFEVTLEDGIVTGWKDRRNRGTRDI